MLSTHEKSWIEILVEVQNFQCLQLKVKTKTNTETNKLSWKICFLQHTVQNKDQHEHVSSIFQKEGEILNDVYDKSVIFIIIISYYFLFCFIAQGFDRKSCKLKLLCLILL